MSADGDRLFQLLPAVHRLRDAAQGGALQNLVAIFADVLDAIDRDVTGLYENWFIETCAEWVVPYIGDLLRTRPLHAASPETFTARAYVAHTLAYRQRKGTLGVLGQLARDVTGWPARGVEFFQLLATTQYLNHVRPGNVVTPDLRNTSQLELLGGPFEQASHTADVRGIVDPPLDPALAPDLVNDAIGIRGKYDIPNVGLFLWRLRSYALTLSTPRAVTNGSDGRYRFHAAGLDAPLFNQPPTHPAFTRLAGEIDVPGALRRRALYDELEARRQTMVDRMLIWTPSTVFPLGAEIADANGNTERAVQGGKSGAGAPAWPRQIGGQAVDGQVTWQLVAGGFALAGAAYFGSQPVLQIFPAGSSAALWAPNTAYALGAVVPDANGNTEQATVSGVSGKAPPVWPTTLGGTVNDNTVQWQRVANGFGPAPPPEQIMICDLADLPPPAPPGTWRQPPASKAYRRSSDGASITLPIQASVDPVLGRLAFAAIPAQPAELRVSCSYGFSADLGGGPYNRAGSISSLLAGTTPWLALVSQELPPQTGLFAKLADAVDAWNGLPPASPRLGVIAILDSRTYVESLTGTHQVQIPEGSTLLIVAADRPSLHLPTAAADLVANGQRPHLLGALSVKGTAPAASNAPGALIVNGLLIEGSVTVLVGNLGSLQVAHSTVLPQRGGLAVNPSVSPGSQNSQLQVSLERCICGPISLPATVASLSLADSIVDAGTGTAIAAPGADANIQSSTIFGAVAGNPGNGLRTLNAGNSIFTGAVVVERTQAGCVRFCSLPTDASKTPRRYRCQPDLAIGDVTDPGLQAAIRARLTPSFNSPTYGAPGYAQLGTTCAREIRAGADNGSEMGAFYFLQQPQRDTNLRVALLEYLRFGLQAGIFYVT